jgi:hypothetical protein
MGQVRSGRTLMIMPVLLEFSGDGAQVRAGGAARTAAREQAAALMTALAPMTRVARLDVPVELAGIRISRTPIGPVSLIQWRGFDYCQTATAKTTDGVPEGISLAVRPTGRWSLSQASITRCSETNDFLTVVDVTQAMRVELDADTTLWQMFFSAEQLGLSVDEIRAAAKVIEHSPLRELTASHLLHLSSADDDILPPEALRSVGRATIELVRAMLISAARPDECGGSEVSGEALRYAVKQHIQRHLHDPGLSPRRRRQGPPHFRPPSLQRLERGAGDRRAVDRPAATRGRPRRLGEPAPCSHVNLRYRANMGIFRSRALRPAIPGRLRHVTPRMARGLCRPPSLTLASLPRALPFGTGAVLPSAASRLGWSSHCKSSAITAT